MIMFVACALLLGAATYFSQPAWKYEGQLHNAIQMADRIVVLDGGYDQDSVVDKYTAICQITDAAVVKDEFENLRFEVGQSARVCNCRGYPTIVWFCGEKRLARTSVQHGKAIRWEGFLGDGQVMDAELTKESGAWLVNCLVRNGVPKPKMSLRRPR
jgi:hypothetical protein